MKGFDKKNSLIKAVSSYTEPKIQIRLRNIGCKNQSWFRNLGCKPDLDPPPWIVIQIQSHQIRNRINLGYNRKTCNSAIPGLRVTQ